MLSSPSFFAPSTSFCSRSGPASAPRSAVVGLPCAWAMPAARSAAATRIILRFMSVLLLLDLAPFEEELAPDLLPLVVLVERDDGVDHLEREFVEVRVHRKARRDAVALLEDGLAFLRQHEVDEDHRRARVRRAARHADRVGPPESGRDRLPLDRRALHG